MQIPKTVEELEKLIESWRGNHRFHLIEPDLRKAFTLGLQEAREAGPKERTFFGEESEFCHEHSEKDCEFCQGQNVMLSAKNSAISALIEKGEQGKV